MKFPRKQYLLFILIMFCTLPLLFTAHVFAAAPLPPANVSASDGMHSGKIQVTWTGSAGADAYDVFRAEMPVSLGGTITKIGTTFAAVYDDTSVACDNLYYYWVKAKNADGASKYSAYNSGYCMTSATFSLAIAADNTQLSFETGGDADWFWQNTRHYKMQDAAESGDISESQESWIQTTVTGPGMIEFFWKVSSQNNADFLEFYIDDSLADAISGTVHWSQKQFQVLSGTHTFNWRFVKNDQFSGGLDCGWVDSVKWISNIVAQTAVPSDPPATPTGVSATDGEYTDRIRVTWNASANATTYDVYRAASFSSPQTKIGSTTKNFYDDTAAVACGSDASYYYWVKAINSAGASDLFYSDLGYKSCPFIPEVTMAATYEDTEIPADIIDEPLFLDPPESVSATDGVYREKVSITWSQVTGATSYEVYRHSDCCGRRTLIGTTPDTSFDDRDTLSTNVNYYWVKATNQNTTSIYSDYNTGHKLLIPRPPINVAASDGTYVSRIHITWDPYQRTYPVLSCNEVCVGDPVVENVDEYDVYRADWSEGTKTKIGTTSNTWFDDLDIPCDSCSYIYYYWVVAKNIAGSSRYSDHDSGYAYKTLLDPNDVRATDGTIYHCVRVTWSPVSGAVSYNIYRSETFDGVKTKLGSIGPPCCDNTICCTKFLDDTPVCPKIYYYWVQSVDKKGISSCKFLYYDTGFCSGD
ncbi:MAG: hypothetical protein HF978_04360 [Desulfobacteraceae bacterium]|nr:hypothetical protein [Desulfobacteraceae bacterium]MBC2754761.1 hypothetical protein [Desulfobacteraceae bacterium]